MVFSVHEFHHEVKDILEAIQIYTRGCSCAQDSDHDKLKSPRDHESCDVKDEHNYHQSSQSIIEDDKNFSIQEQMLHTNQKQKEEIIITQQLSQTEHEEICHQHRKQKEEIIRQQLVESTTVESATAAPTLSSRWSKLIIEFIHRPLISCLQFITSISARNPKSTIAIVVMFSIGIFVTGLCTNFRLEADENDLWTPLNSDPVKHQEWITKEGSRFGNGFLFNMTHEVTYPPLVNMTPEATQPPIVANESVTQGAPVAPDIYLLLLFHNEGKNALGDKQLRMIMNASDEIILRPSYNDICKDGSIEVRLPNGTQIRTCAVSGVQRFWNFSSLWYDWSVTNDEQAIKAVSARQYPGGEYVDEEFVFGYPVRDNATDRLTSVLSYLSVYVLPNTHKTDAVKLDFVDTIVNLNKKWQSDNETAGFHVEIWVDGAFQEEFTRGILDNIILVPFVVLFMSIFCCAYFYRQNKVQSRMLLSLAALASVILSLLQGYGLLFVCGIPFTTMTQMIPFLIMGVGLDDAFIIIDTYERSDATKTPVERISDTIQECGFSIFLTTLMSSAAFAIGCTSSVPAIYWLCLYAFPTVSAVLFCQLTFFVACVVLDERRIQSRRPDLCCCVKIQDFQEYAHEVYKYNKALTEKETFTYRFMNFFAVNLLKPKVQTFVLISFFAFTGLAAWSTSKFETRFDISDALPDGSYVSSFLYATQNYRETEINAAVYFRNEDFSDEYVRYQMEKYMDDLVAMKSVTGQPPYFWPRDFQEFLISNNFTSSQSFNDQVKVFLNNTEYAGRHLGNMAFSENGTLIAYRTSITLGNVKLNDLTTQIDAYREQYAVSYAQPINRGKAELSFFTFEATYMQWAFISSSTQQLIQSTVIGILSVTGIAFIFIPHWTAVFIVCPIVCMMYIDILGILQWAGVYINAVSVVTVVMSIGLIVDYIIHVLLGFYEMPGSDRRERTRQTLCTVGTSVLAGGFSTFLGTVPLAFSTNEIFYVVFISFVSLVSVAVAYGLIFLPVVLAFCGPTAEHHMLKHTELASKSTFEDSSDTITERRYSL